MAGEWIKDTKNSLPGTLDVFRLRNEKKYRFRKQKSSIPSFKVGFG